MGSGLILDDTGRKMSKSSANGVSPLEVIDKYGADAARLHVHFLGGYEDNTPWTYDGINGITAFLNRVWKLPEMVKGEDVSEEHIYELNRLIKKVEEDYENLQLNTAIAACMSFVKRVREDGFITRDELKKFLVILNPMAPFITSELYENVFSGDILDEQWPEYDTNYLQEDTIELPIQVKGKKVRIIKVSSKITEEELVAMVKDTYPELFDGRDIRKVIYVPRKIINFIV